MEPDDPPRKHYGLKARAFDRVNPARPEAPGNAAPAAAPAAADSGKIDVYEILRQNQAKAQQAGLNEVVPKRVVSRRRRDYWLALGGAETLLGTLVVLGRHNVVVVVFGGSGMLLVAIALTWIMWSLMDDY